MSAEDLSSLSAPHRALLVAYCQMTYPEGGSLSQKPTMDPFRYLSPAYTCAEGSEN